MAWLRGLLVWGFVWMSAFVPAVVNAEPATGVIEARYAQPVNRVQKALYSALENEGFFVVFRADMGQRMEAMKKRWGDGYNRHGLTAVRAMVFCNIDWTHQLADADPVGLAVCPLHATLYERNGQTHILIPRPTVSLQGTLAEARATELEAVLTRIVQGLF